MSEWSEVRLRDVATVYDGPHATPQKTEDGPWYLSISSLRNGRFDLAESAHLAESDLATWTRRVSPTPGDTLFSYETRIGEAAHWSIDAPAALGRRMGLLRPNLDLVDARFLTYAYLGPQFQNVIRTQTVHGATVERLLIADMPNWPMALPPLGEQRRIAGVLGALDDLIENNRQLARAVEDQMLTLFAAEGFDAEPNGEVVTLAELVEVNPKLARPAGDAPYVDMAALPTDSSRIATVARRPAVGGARFQNGDTLLARLTPCLENGKAAFVDVLTPGEIAVGSTEFLVLRDRGALGPHWPYVLTRSERFRDYAIRHMNGSSGRQRCSAESVEAYQIVPPAPDALARFRTAAAPAFGAIGALNDEIAELTRARDELLPLLMSGRVRVREVA